MVGKPRRSGLRVSGELPPPPPPSGRPGASSGTPFSQAPCAPSGAEHTTVDAFAETWDDKGGGANGIDAVMAAVAALMKDQARQFNVTAELRRQELRNKRIAKYTKLVLANPGNDMYAKMLAAEAAGEDGDGDEDASP